jgi:hypothetical protein
MHGSDTAFIIQLQILFLALLFQIFKQRFYGEDLVAALSVHSSYYKQYSI